jgi:hypothetical protein
MKIEKLLENKAMLKKAWDNRTEIRLTHLATNKIARGKRVFTVQDGEGFVLIPNSVPDLYIRNGNGKMKKVTLAQAKKHLKGV